MRTNDPCFGGFTIDASAVPDAARNGYLARIVIRRMPAMQEVLREEFAGGAQAFDEPNDALAAAFARGQRFVRSQFLGQLAGSRQGAINDVLPWPSP